MGILSASTVGAPAAGWLAPTSTPPGAWTGDAQDMALDAEGNAVAVWTANGLPWRVIQAATRPAGGAWSPLITLSPPGEEGGWDPAVAVGANGDAVAVWSSVRHDGGIRQIVLAATREAGGQWSEPEALSDEAGIPGYGLALTYEPEVVVDAEGNATAIWSEETGYASAIRTRSRPNGGDWSAPVELTAREDRTAWSPQMAVSPQGEVTAIWNWTEPENSGGIIQSASRPAGGEWTETIDLSDSDGRAHFPHVAVDPEGNAVAVWKSSTDDRVQAARRATGVGWSAAVNVSDAPGAADFTDVAIDPKGTATAVWETNDGVGRLVHASTSAAGDAWSDPVDISIRDDGSWLGAFPQVTADAQGDVTVIWRNFYEPHHNRVTAARREDGGSWSAPVELGEANGVIEPMRVAADPQGYVTALWSAGKRLFSAVYDPIAPLLHGVTIPASGVVGQPVAMSVDPFDLWSPVTTGWTFGDGASGAGPNVEHCYSTPGDRTVTITGTDPAANLTSTSRTIRIDPAPAPTPGTDPCAAPKPDPNPEPDPDPDTEPSPNPDPDPSPSPDPDPNPGPEGDPQGHDANPPIVSGLKQSAARWRTRRAHRPPRLPIGTTFRFRLNQRAHVRLTFTRLISGRRVRARCVKATKTNRDHRPCRSHRPRGRLKMTAVAGDNAYRFRGRTRRHTLKPGRYRLRVTALQDGKPSSAATVRFRIVR